MQFRKSLIVAAAFLLSLVADKATAQMLAFPGAEGAGKFAKGGRDGDVYIVSNLNNSGVGSLRHAVDTSPSSGRTIVFSVGGTINLQSDIVIDRPNITIAGQTAPGGITLARRALRVDDTHDVILQHIRVRPGDYYTAPNVYEPDSLWVAGSDDVIVDHVSASWSTDEVLSVTHGSTNVTVQWSMMTEALHNSNHSKGNHGYGSIIHGGETTLHHNLYAHNRSRNPATGNWDKDNPITPAHLDIVNNVIFNPGDRYSYSGGDDQYEVNWAGNFGIEGPNTTRENELFHPDNVNSIVYYNGNYYDTNEDGILQVTPASPSTLTGTYTQVGTPIDTTAPPNQTDAATAYMQVLSYAGAASYRDPIDKRVLNTVINQTGDHLDSQDEVGGWYEPVPSNVVLDPDGLPDWWKIEKGLNPDDNTIGLQNSGDGYTWLEKYLHELNASYLPPQPDELSAMSVSTAFGSGADASVSENDNLSSGDGGSAELTARWNNNDRNEYSLLRFDLSQVEAGTIRDAALELTAFQDMADRRFRVYGLDHEHANQLWDANSIEFDGAPGLTFDGDSSTRGRNDNELLLLGEFESDNVAEGSVVSFDSPDLAVFLNMLSYRYDGDGDAITLLIERVTNSNGLSLFASAEATHLSSTAEGSVAAGTYAPRLLLDAIAAAVALPGDFNGNGVVDAADYAVWLSGLGETYTYADYQTWKANFGATLAGAASSGAAVPEPASLLLGVVPLLVAASRRSRPW